MENKRIPGSNKNIIFDTSFIDKNEEKGYEYQSSINNEDLGIKLKLGMNNAGYLKNAIIKFDSSSKLNFKLGEISGNEFIESNTENAVKLNQIKSDKELNLIIPIKYTDTENMDNLKNDTEVTLTGIYVDNKGNYSNVTEKVIMSLSWLSNSKVTINSKITKFVKYKSNNKNGLIAQTELTIGLDKKNMPIDKTEITLDALKINECALEKITIISNQRENIAEEDWKYNEQTGKINISVSNEKMMKDTETFIITYIFKEDTKINFPIKYNSFINCNILMKETSEKISGDFNAVYNISKEVGDIVTYSAQVIEPEISKGNIIANKYDKNNNYETEYSYKYILNVAETTLLDKIVLKDIDETAKSKNNQYYNLAKTSHYQEVKISKSNFDNILGQDGKVEIYNVNGEKVSTISKENDVIDNSYYKVDISENELDKIKIVTSKPINVGNLEVITSKKIVNTNYNINEIKSFKEIISKTVASIFYEGNIENNVGEEITSVKLNNTKTNATLSINRKSLGTTIKNENVELKIELNNNKVGTDFYKNPVFEVILPKQIKEITVKKVSVINADEAFKIKKATARRENENIIVRIELNGTQKSYSLNDITNGTNILINTDITIDEFTPNKKESITLNYKNENATVYDLSNSNYGISKEDIEYVAPSGLVSINTISNYDKNNSKVTSIEQGVVTGKLEIYSDSKISKMDILVMNNNENKVKDIKILGRIPFKGNKDVETGKELGTTLDTTLINGISSSNNKVKTKIYYSNNGDATSDIENPENGWTTNISDFSKVKSYLIICDNDYEMNTGEMLKFSYNYKIPANLEHNEELYGSFATYYTNITDVSTNKEVSVADKVGLITGEGPKLSIETKLNGTNNEVNEYEYVQYSVTVKNTGAEDAEDVIVTVPVPTEATFANYKGITSVNTQGGWSLDTSKERKYKVGTLKPNESKTYKFYVQISKLPTIEQYYGRYTGFTKNSDGTYSIYVKVIDESGNETYKETKITELPDIHATCTAYVTAKDLSKKLESNKTENKVVSSDIISSETVKTETEVANVNEEMTYEVNIKNTSKNDIKDIKIEKILPSEVSYIEAYVVGYESDGVTSKKINSVSYNEGSRKIVWTVDSLSKGRTVHLKAKVKSNDLPNGIYEKDVVTSSTIKVNEKEYKTSEISTKIGKPKLVISQVSDVTNKFVTENQAINYKFTIKNEGLVKAQNVSIVDKLPSKVKVRSLSYISDGIKMKKVVSNNKDATVSTSIQPNSELEVNVKAVTLSIDKKHETIENYATVSADNSMSNENTNMVTHIIEKTKNDKTPTLDDDEKVLVKQEKVSESKYKITGSAWLDTDKNGKYTKNDVMISNLETVLINATTGKQVAKTTTSARGTYTFDGLSKGKYYVGFYYNAKKYGLTEYKKKGVAENINSDAYASQINKTAIALTDIININKTSISNIDIGLIEATVFDLSLNKKVAKITVQNKSGTKKYMINNNMAKIDIPAKYLSSSKVYIEYSISVKNEGELIGYAKQIVDYKEKGLTFSQDLNPNWYEGSDGNIYSEALAKKAIHPGKTLELKLILTKQMTDSNTGIINNTAEITKSYNTSGIADRDSVPNNKIQSEDDFSSADTIISVKTGETLIYTSAILTIIVIIMISMYIAHKNRFKIRRVLRKRKVVD